MALTTNYKATMFLGGDDYDATEEQRRWTTFDVNLGALVGLLANGVISGWTVTAGTVTVVVEDHTEEHSALLVAPGSGLIPAGSGQISLAAISEVEQAIDVSTYATPYSGYVYAAVTADTYWTATVVFDVSETVSIPDDAILLASFDIDESSVITVTDLRTQIGLSADMLEEIRTHHHDGGSGSGHAPLVNLETDVTGLLDASHIGEIPASKIIGQIPASALGAISHKDLTDIGDNTHDQIDDFITSLPDSRFQHFARVQLANRLQNTVNLNHLVGNEVNRDMVNERVVIPGITPDAYIDWLSGVPAILEEDRTAWTTNHDIEGIAAEALVTPVEITKTWDRLSGDGGFTTPPDYVDSQNVDIQANGIGATVKLDPTLIEYYYSTDGYFTVLYDARATVHWNAVDWTAAVIGVGTIGAVDGPGVAIRVQSGASRGDLSDDDTAWTTWSTAAVTALQVEDNRFIRIQVRLTPGVDDGNNISTPALTYLSIGYTTGHAAQCAYLIYDAQRDWLADASAVYGIDFDTQPGDVMPQAVTLYKSSGSLISPVLDGCAEAETFRGWSCLWLNYVQLLTGAVTVYVRGSHSDFDPASTALTWQQLKTLKPIYNLADTSEYNTANYAVTSYHRYLQIKLVLTCPALTYVSPEIISVGLNYWAESSGTNPVLHYKHWGTPGNGRGCWNETGSTPAVSANVTNIDGATTTVSPTNTGVVTNPGAITVDDKTQGIAIWRSPAFRAPEAGFASWEGIRVTGENLGSVKVYVQYSSDPQGGWTDLTLCDNTTGASPFDVVIDSVTTPWIRVELRLEA